MKQRKIIFLTLFLFFFIFGIFSFISCQACNHVWVQETIEATCTHSGYSQKRCYVCGEIKDKIETSTKQEHQTEEVVVAPTCTEEGYSYTKCKNCDFTGLRYHNVVVSGHTLDNDYTCSVCGEQILNFVLHDGYYSVSENSELTNKQINGTVSIPDTYQGLPVTAIDDQAFRATNISDIELPESLTSIGDYAFLSPQLNRF